MTLKLDLQHQVLKYYQIYSSDDPGLTLTYFTARSDLVPYAFVWGKGKTIDFSETIVIYDSKLATDDQSDKKFLLTSKLCLQGAVCPLPQVSICKKSDFKEMFLKLAANGLSDKAFQLTSKFCPLRAVCLCPRAVYMYYIIKKNCIKSDFKDIFFKLATNEWSDEMFLLTLKFCPVGAVCPCPGAIYRYEIIKKFVYNHTLKRFFLNLQQMNEVTRHFSWHQNFVPWGLSAPAQGLYTCIKS